MAGIPQNFQAISNVLANYDFVDIVSGTGIINFYAGTAYSDAATYYLISNNTFYSNDIFLSATTSSGSYTKVLDLDFDVVLNRPLDVKGKTVVNVPLCAKHLGGNTSYVYAVVKVRKWDGSTETDLVSSTGYISHTSGAAGNPAWYMDAIYVNIPLTHFKIGETLRLTIEVWGASSAGSATQQIGCDPMNRTTGWDTSGAVPSKLVFQCPVRLNL